MKTFYHLVSIEMEFSGICPIQGGQKTTNTIGTDCQTYWNLTSEAKVWMGMETELTSQL